MQQQTDTLAPQVGAFATFCIGSDRWPVEIIETTATRVTVRAAELDDDGKPMQRPAGMLDRFTLRKDGRWRLKGSEHGWLDLTRCDEYRDPHF